MSTTTERLKGEALLEYVKDHANDSKTEQCIGAGYVRDTGLSKTAAFTDFYESLLEAKKAVGQLTNGCIITSSIPTHDGPAIYVACLASYNRGILYGAWISLEWCEDTDEISQAIQEILNGSPVPDAEEYAIHDSQSLPEFLSSQEWPDLEDLNTFAEVSANVDDREPYVMACDNESRILTEDEFRECYYGHHSSPAHFVQEWYEDTGMLSEVPDHLIYHINWDSIWNDMDCSGWRAEYANGGYYIFSDY